MLSDGVKNTINTTNSIFLTKTLNSKKKLVTLSRQIYHQFTTHLQRIILISYYKYLIYSDILSNSLTHSARVAVLGA